MRPGFPVAVAAQERIERFSKSMSVCTRGPALFVVASPLLSISFRPSLPPSLLYTIQLYRKKSCSMNASASILYTRPGDKKNMRESDRCRSPPRNSAEGGRKKEKVHVQHLISPLFLPTCSNFLPSSSSSSFPFSFPGLTAWGKAALGRDLSKINIICLRSLLAPEEADEPWSTPLLI